jgi:hypothetical protein
MRLERFTKGELEKARRAYSLIIFTTLLVKLLFVFGWLERKGFEDKLLSKRIADSIVISNGWPWWQINLVTEAALTYFLFFFADAALARVEAQQAWKEEIVLDTLSTISFAYYAPS